MSWASIYLNECEPIRERDIVHMWITCICAVSTTTAATFPWPIKKQNKNKQKIDVRFRKVQNKVNVVLHQQGQWSWEGSWAVWWLWWWINPQCRQCWADNPELLGSAASSYAPHHGHVLGHELLTVERTINSLHYQLYTFFVLLIS